MCGFTGHSEDRALLSNMMCSGKLLEGWGPGDMKWVAAGPTLKTETTVWVY